VLPRHADGRAGRLARRHLRNGARWQYIKDYLGKSDNVTWFMLQSEPNAVSPYHYEIVFKPQNVIPSFTGSDAG
jgi:hypothetical protein